MGGSAVEGSAVAAATVAAAVAKAAAATVAARADEAALSAAAEAAAACSRGGGAAVCGRLRRWRWVMAAAVVEEEVRRSRGGDRGGFRRLPRSNAPRRAVADLCATRSAGVSTLPRRSFESWRGFESGRAHLGCRPLTAPDGPLVQPTCGDGRCGRPHLQVG